MSDKNRLFVVWNECVCVCVCVDSVDIIQAAIFICTRSISIHLFSTEWNVNESEVCFNFDVCVCRPVECMWWSEIRMKLNVFVQSTLIRLKKKKNFWFRPAILYFSINCVVVRILSEQSMLFHSQKCSKYRIYIKIRIRQRHWAVRGIDRFMEALNSHSSFQLSFRMWWMMQTPYIEFNERSQCESIPCPLIENSAQLFRAIRGIAIDMRYKFIWRSKNGIQICDFNPSGWHNGCGSTTLTN